MSTAPKASPGPGQEGLLDEQTVGDLRRAGRVERAMVGALEAAQLEDVDKGVAALLLEACRAVDVASTRSDPYGVAAALREARELAARLRLDPVSRDGAPTGDVERFLRDLNTAT